VLRNEDDGEDHRHLDAYVDEKGLHIDGHDLGPGTFPPSDDGEYEWFQTIAPEHLPRLVALLGGAPSEDVLDVLERDWTAPGRSYDLEKLLRESKFPMSRFVYY
jgi:hypothetical protein